VCDNELNTTTTTATATTAPGHPLLLALSREIKLGINGPPTEKEMGKEKFISPRKLWVA